MAWAYVQDNPEVTLDLYDRVASELGEGNPAGLVVHVAGEGPKGGVRIIDVWESRQAYERFRDERLIPAIERVTGSPPDSPQVTMEELNVHHLVRDE
jgi:hypothetical protein